MILVHIAGSSEHDAQRHSPTQRGFTGGKQNLDLGHVILDDDAFYWRLANPACNVGARFHVGVLLLWDNARG